MHIILLSIVDNILCRINLLSVNSEQTSYFQIDCFFFWSWCKIQTKCKMASDVNKRTSILLL